MPWYEMTECSACYKTTTRESDGVILPDDYPYHCPYCHATGPAHRLTYFEETKRMDDAEWDRIVAYWRSKKATR